MYLFQPYNSRGQSLYWHNLHSTMYLFQPMLQFPKQDLSQYLHSTMYLFQQNQVAISVREDRNLHSTMYLFQLLPHGRGWFASVFTFHYVSISTDYIDLVPCDYVHLHSTMYLFQRRRKLLCATMCDIYIPLCIYFNSHNSKRYTINHYLHSTMYLFQLMLYQENKYNPSFTFHYVSISTYIS